MAALSRYSNRELLEFPDCDGLGENGKCKWLNVSGCTGDGCPYFHKKGTTESSYIRLRSLDEEVQKRIALKYYNGTRPWNKNR
ncbi:MAG: hypothetical protein RSA97_05715 [Oscillospiraceae bacterium]